MNTQDYPEITSSRWCYNIYNEITSGRTAVENSTGKITNVYSKAVRALITVALKELDGV